MRVNVYPQEIGLSVVPVQKYVDGVPRHGVRIHLALPVAGNPQEHSYDGDGKMITSAITFWGDVATLNAVAEQFMAAAKRVIQWRATP